MLNRDYGTFDPTLKVPNVATGTAPTGQLKTTYGPELMRLIADYKGTIVWGTFGCCFSRKAQRLTGAP